MPVQRTNFTAESIVMATSFIQDSEGSDKSSIFDPRREDIVPDPPHIRADLIWPDYMIDWR
jgi:hypothetical protein